MRFQVKCLVCDNKEMTFDDQDYNFKGNFDNYYTCEKCGSCGAIVSIRYNRAVRVSYAIENTDRDTNFGSADINKYVNDTLQGSEF